MRVMMHPITTAATSLPESTVAAPMVVMAKDVMAMPITGFHGFFPSVGTTAELVVSVFAGNGAGAGEGKLG